MSRVALVTGAAQGIGKAISLKLARQGLDIAITDIASKKAAGEAVVNEIKQLGRNSVFIAADSSDRQQVFDAVETTYQKLGGFNVMVNNAGICITASIADATEDQLMKMAKVNIGGVLYGIQAASQMFQKLGDQPGRIINASSIAGHEGFGLIGIYSSTKFAVRGLSQAAAKELSGKGITVNCFCPGPVRTEMLDGISATADEYKKKDGSDDSDTFGKTLYSGKLATVDDIADLVGFLASDEAKAITGQAFICDGGMVFK